MHRVIVIGGVNHDRIWQLKTPLQRGGRLGVASKEIRLGGGAFFTGSQLLELGAEVAIVTWLRQDTLGFSALDTLRQMGFDTAEVGMESGETSPLEILLEPDGERTIMSLPGHARPPFRINTALRGDAAYINALILDAALVRHLDNMPIVITQLPLSEATPLPADYVISSRDDASGNIDAVWLRAKAIAGDRLKMLILTDGPNPITLFDGREAVEVAAAPRVETTSAIGAGDRFSGALLFALLNGETEKAAVTTASRQTANWLRQYTGA